MQAAIQRRTIQRTASLAVLELLLLLVAVGCGPKQSKLAYDQEELAPEPDYYAQPARQSYQPAYQPAYQAPPRDYYPQSQRSSASGASGRIPITPVPAGGVTEDDYQYIQSHAPLETEFGQATWYTAPYRGRKAANGQVFDDFALTAAHRTLPMGSLVVVTNLKTGQSSAMRITDRGPFVEGRIVDLTIASARATGVYREGLSQVRVDVYATPKPIEVGGRWCVQIGAFHSEEDAIQLKQELLGHYPSARVIEFPGEKEYWVRIRPEGDDRSAAEYIAHHLRPIEGVAFLTRLD